MKKVKCPWIVKGSKTVYQNPWIKVTEDKIIFPNNKPGIYGVVSMPDTVAVAAFENDGIYLVKQYRYTVKKNSWELPSGHIKPEETPLKAASRELGEEAGLKAKKWISLGYSNPAIGVMSTTRYLYFATGLSLTNKQREPSEIDMEVKWFHLKVVEKMIENNSIFDDYLITALYKLNQAI